MFKRLSIAAFLTLSMFGCTCVQAVANIGEDAQHNQSSAFAQAGAAAAAQAGAVGTANVSNQVSVTSNPVIQSSNTQGSTQASVNVVNERAASTAYSAGLTSGLDTCMGSSSAGFQAMGFGISAGTTWTDENCKRLKNSRELRSMGLDAAALALMCQDESVARAMRTAGTVCKGE